jgi:glycogen(starch) synthase
MKILLIGPYPPPHGGVSVHVAEIAQRLTAAGVPTKVIDTARVQSWSGFAAALIHHALRRWTIHLHTNGHNRRSWLLALGCGLAGLAAEGSVLTLHSGLVPEYLTAASFPDRLLAKLVCAVYSRIICVSPAIRDSIVQLGVPDRRVELAPAYLGAKRPPAAIDRNLRPWILAHRPVLSTALFFRPEYGFEALVAAVVRLRRRHPSLGCLVMGAGEQRDLAETLVREAGLETHVLLLGDVKHETCLRLMSMSDVFVRPTLRDGDSISVREALALGVPVVASRTASRPAGPILFEPGHVDGMISGIDMALAGNWRAAAPQPDSMDRLMAVYRRVVAHEGAYGSS